MVRKRSLERSQRVVGPVRAGLLLAFLSVAGCAGDGSEDVEAAPAQGSGSVAADLLAEPPPMARRDTVQETIDIRELGYDQGFVDAPIKIVEFSDFGCGYCRKFHQETYDSLYAEYVATGKVLWKYVPFVIGMFPNGDGAGLAGECGAEQGRFFQMSAVLFEKQPEWKGSANAGPLFQAYAESVGLDAEQFASCMAEQRPQRKLRTAYRAAQALGIQGTPTFFINGYPIQGALPIGIFRDIFTSELTRITESGGGQP